MAERVQGGSRVEDLRYTRYDGARRGRLACLASFARQGALHALGAGRGWRGKLIPFALIFFAFAPALIVLGVRALFASRVNQDISELAPYSDYYTTVAIIILALAGMVTPELLCPDRRDRVLDLYYSTAVSPREYLAAKFGAAMMPLLLTTLAPVLFLFAGNVLFALHPLGYVQDHWKDVPRIIGAGFVIASYFVLVGLAISSLTSRRAFAMGGAVALLVASSATSAVLAGLGASNNVLVLALPLVPVILAQRMFPPVEGQVQELATAGWLAAYLVVCGVSLLVLLLRYRRAERLTDAVVVDGVSRWFRDRVAVADVSFAAGPGVTGLLGHNGAGKTTVLRLLSGFTSPSRGSVRILGSDPRSEPDVFRRVGLVPDGDGLWPFMTAHGAVSLLGRLRGVADPDAAAHRALQTVGLDEVADRKLAGFSKGMRQGIKLAQALVHDPDVLLLDEPLNGLDPARRRAFVELVQRLGDEGKTVIVSSHVLHEVERMAPRVVVLVNGRLVAEGETASIRALIADRPRSVRVEAGTGTRELAQALVGAGLADAVRLQDGGALLETPDPDALARQLPQIARERSITVSRVEPVGDDLESVYAYLHARARGAAR